MQRSGANIDKNRLLDTSQLESGKKGLLANNGDAMVSDSSDIKKVIGEVQVINKMGLHARPAMQFVDLANKFACRIRVYKEEQCVNAKSIMELLLLAAAEGTNLTIQAEGPDANKAVEELTDLVNSKFNEE